MTCFEFEILAEKLRQGDTTVWLRRRGESATPGLSRDEVADACARFARFAPALAALFPESGWDGRVRSDLLRLNGGPLLKADHALPMTGSVKARGGVHELLCRIEDIARAERLIEGGGTLDLLRPDARAALSHHRILVASTGNLGYSIGLVARAFGLAAEIHMSHDAKTWKKDRLRALGATVVEHRGDYAEAVAGARRLAEATGDYFIDDENSRRLFAGYAPAGDELAEQLEALGIEVSVDAPLVVYLPCGVGGAPGGVTSGLKHRFGDAVVPVLVEPTASACMLVALATGRADSVYEYGLNNVTLADGLAVPRASELVLDLVGDAVAGVVALPDHVMLASVKQAWESHRLRLEPSAAASLAAIGPFLAARRERGDPVSPRATHVAWATGGGRLPDDEFQRLLDPAA